MYMSSASSKDENGNKEAFATSVQFPWSCPVRNMSLLKSVKQTPLKSDDCSLSICGHHLITVWLQGESGQTAPSPVCVLVEVADQSPWSKASLFILSRRSGDLSLVGYSAVSVILIRRIICTPEAESPLEFADHHLNAVRSFLRHPPFRCSIYLCDTLLQEASSLLILPLKSPISTAYSADTGISMARLPYPSFDYHNLI